MKVTIMYRNSFIGGDGWSYYPMNVEIADTCPVCGGPRGKPYGHNFYEDGETYHVHRWDNPCGHVDLYKDVYFEHVNRQVNNDTPMPRKPWAMIGEGQRGTYCLYFEDIDDGSTPVGTFPSKAKATSIAELNGYEVVETPLQKPCGGGHA
jgi:hypothetical protein